MKKALIAMSGGVDSSVAAFLMQQMGYDCIGVTMKLFEKSHITEIQEKTCGSSQDAEDARLIAKRLRMPFYLFDFTDIFEEKVIKRFANAYEHGWTPNPCIDCNRHLKFDQLFLRMQEMQLNTIVTGHYAQVVYDAPSGRYLLKKGADQSKDQSYVLYNLKQNQLAHIQFPIGKLPKTQVRKIAEQNGFVNAAKPDSQDICFIPDNDYAGFIERYTGKKSEPGNFLNTAGEVIGTHKGVIYYTIGQRRGLGISAPEPLYVCSISLKDNTVTLGYREDLYATGLTATDVNMISCETLPEPTAVEAKIRYRQPAQPATAWQSEDGCLHVKFQQPQRAITCGQAVVLYQGDTVVGGGTICNVHS